jgi:hypothetical protein
MNLFTVSLKSMAGEQVRSVGYRITPLSYGNTWETALQPTPPRLFFAIVASICLLLRYWFISSTLDLISKLGVTLHSQKNFDAFQ